MTGVQALVRLPLVQRELDKQAGLNTAGYISGYRGSPLGGYDQQLEKNYKLLEESQIKFQPGVNEDLAATALWGTQQAEIRGEGKYDGIFGIWYGKGPGVDRSGARTDEKRQQAGFAVRADSLPQFFGAHAKILIDSHLAQIFFCQAGDSGGLGYRVVDLAR